MLDSPSRAAVPVAPGDLLFEERRSARSLAEHFVRTRVGDPAARACVRLGIPADTITVTSGAVVALGAILLGAGALGAGGCVYLLGASLDALDGRVARMVGKGTRAGAFLDSTMDRVGELLALGGLALAVRATPALVAVLVTAGASVVVSYARARGEALGAGEICKVGMMQRPQRVAWVGITCALSPMAESSFGNGAGYALVAGSLFLLAIATALTAAARVLAVYRALSAVDRG